MIRGIRQGMMILPAKQRMKVLKNGGKMNRIVHAKATLACRISRAFSYFPDAGEITKWLCEMAVIDREPGGKYELYWDTENPNQNSTIGCRMTCLKENVLIGFEWKGPVQFTEEMNCLNPLTHVTVVFSINKNNPEHTDIDLIHTGWPDTEGCKKAREYFDAVWAKALKALEEQAGR